MNNQDIAKHSAAMLDLFEAEQQRILLLDPKERAMQHNYQKTMAVCYELRTFIRSIDAKPSAVLEAAPASSASAQAVDASEPEAKGNISAWLRRRAHNDLVMIPGRLAGQIADHIDSLQSQQSPVQASDAGRQG